MIRLVLPGSGSYFTHPGSRGQKGTGSRIRISNTGHKWCVIYLPLVLRKVAPPRGPYGFVHGFASQFVHVQYGIRAFKQPKGQAGKNCNLPDSTN